MDKTVVWIVILAAALILFLIRKRKTRVGRLIKYKKLIRKRGGIKYFRRVCPNCGNEETIKRERQEQKDGVPILSDSECESCKFRFVRQKKAWFRFRRGFIMMSSEEYEQYKSSH